MRDSSEERKASLECVIVKLRDIGRDEKMKCKGRSKMRDRWKHESFACESLEDIRVLEMRRDSSQKIDQRLKCKGRSKSRLASRE